MALSADAASVVARLRELGLISAGGPGVNRPGYGPEERAAHERVALWMEQAGLTSRATTSGTCMGAATGRSPASPVWIGSHLDTVPEGGPSTARGVVGGLAALVEGEASGPLRAPSKCRLLLRGGRPVRNRPAGEPGRGGRAVPFAARAD
jgi:N-carbamoyl-L-amino-acid hydrolase